MTQREQIWEDLKTIERTLRDDNSPKGIKAYVACNRLMRLEEGFVAEVLQHDSEQQHFRNGGQS